MEQQDEAHEMNSWVTGQKCNLCLSQMVRGSKRRWLERVDTRLANYIVAVAPGTVSREAGISGGCGAGSGWCEDKGGKPLVNVYHKNLVQQIFAFGASPEQQKTGHAGGAPTRTRFPTQPIAKRSHGGPSMKWRNGDTPPGMPTWPVEHFGFFPFK